MCTGVFIFMEIILEILAKIWLMASRRGNPGSTTDLGNFFRRRVPGRKIIYGFATIRMQFFTFN